MTNPVEQTKQTIASLIAFIGQSPWRTEYLELLNSLKSQAEQPCVLAIAGRVKAGKSSFLNALLGKDLAMVGTTECTATINIFRKGTPPDPERPVLVIWKNGHKEFQPKAFLDALQGNDKKTMQLAKEIKQIEFLLNDSIFDDITLVDTPGTDALVDEHQDTTEEFFGFSKSRDKEEDALKKELRHQQIQETKNKTGEADAVIYLIGPVANATGQVFMQEFQAATGGDSSAMNALGIMAKVDMSDSIITQKEELAASIAEKMQHELNTVIPVSAAIWRALDELKKDNRLELMQKKLKEIPPEGFEYMMKDKNRYYSTSSIFERLFTSSRQAPLTLDERKQLKGDLSWRVFVVISQHLYKYPLEEAIERLTDISGVVRVKDIIQAHFFNRGRILRCFRIANDLGAILTEIERNRLYELNKEVRSRKDFEEFIETHPRTRTDRKTADKLLGFMKTYLKTEQEVSLLTKSLESELIPAVEALQLQLHKTDDGFKALYLLEKNHQIFSIEERTELFSLFGMYANQTIKPDDDNIGRRQQYWNVEATITRNPHRRKVAQYAISAYGSL